jgi:hypothetical protein
MSGSCCGGSTKSEPAKVALTTAQEAIEVAAERPATNSNKSECCNNDKPAKSEKHGCGC